MFRRDKVRAPGYPYIYLYMQISSIRHRPWHARETHHISWTNFLTRNSKTISFSGWEREFHYTVKNVNSGTRIIKLDPPLKVQDKKQIKEQHPKKKIPHHINIDGPISLNGNTFQFEIMIFRNIIFHGSVWFYMFLLKSWGGLSLSVFVVGLTNRSRFLEYNEVVVVSFDIPSWWE